MELMFRWMGYGMAVSYGLVWPGGGVGWRGAMVWWLHCVLCFRGWGWVAGRSASVEAEYSKEKCWKRWLL